MSDLIVALYLDIAHLYSVVVISVIKISSLYMVFRNWIDVSDPNRFLHLEISEPNGK